MMTKQDVVSTSTIEGMSITSYLGMVFGRGASIDAALQNLVDKANDMHANKVIGVYVDTVSTRTYVAQGTAVTVA